MDVNMPFRSISKSTCVLCALLISLTTVTLSSAQDRFGSERSVSRQLGGIVDQLSQSRSDSTSGQSPSSRYQSSGYQSSGGQSMGGRQRLRDDTVSLIESRLRPSSDDGAVAIRPQPMSVRQTSFESAQPVGSSYTDRSPADSRRSLGQLNADQHIQSFIERENASPERSKTSATDLITRIGVNLVFVLALALGGVLMVKYVQKGKLGSKTEPPPGLTGLKIDQVLQVTRGVSLYLVDGMTSRILVAVDSGGIKSVNVLPNRFEDGLDEPEAFSRQSEPEPVRDNVGVSQRQASRRSINKASTSEIDENLIKLLLTKSKEAA